MSDAVTPDGWKELKRLTFNEDGSVDWSQRPSAKRWSMRRLGRAGLLDLLSEHISLRSECLWVFPGAEEPTPIKIAAGIQTALARDHDCHHWFVQVDGRWLIELSHDGTFTFEFSSTRNTKLLKKLRAMEADWAGRSPVRSAQGIRKEQVQALKGVFLRCKVSEDAPVSEEVGE